MYLLFDIGGTNTRVAVSRDGKNLGELRIFQTPADFNEGMIALKKTVLELSGGESIKIAVGGVSGVLSKDKSISISAPNLKGWENQPLKRDLENALGAPVYLENDAALAALGEAVYGAGKGKRIVAYLTISTGVGGARVVSGKLDANALGFEPGRQIINDGKNLEYYIAGASLAKRFGKPPEEINDPEVWDETAKWLARGLNNTIAFWSPDIIVLGGSVMKRVSINKIETYLKETLNEFPVIPEIAPAQLGDLNGLHGALVLAREIVLL